uniref:oligosaccharide flippase family protein n=1 Tax=Marinobacterium profundum TaxID=1714300 RepID=UPI0008365DF4|nr:oligosaccharide flippase family protein [Marinobacterium profundum]
MSQVIGAAFYAMGTRYLSMLIQLASVMAVSRLLTPEEIGIYSITASIFGLALLIRDFGIGSYLIQEKNVDGELAASAFSMSLLLCWPLALVAFICGPYIAAFYELKGMSDVFNFLAINLIIIPFGSITLSLLKREMKFNKIMVIDVGSSLASASVTISCALTNFGFMSLAYGSVAGTLATVCLATVYRPTWLPVLPSVGRLKDIASFGWRISGSNLFTQLNTSSADMILGKVQGPEVAVFFNKAVSVFKLFNQIFQNSLRVVFQSHIAVVSREKRSVIDTVYKLNGLYLLVAWPFCSLLFFQADAVVFILFGSQWNAIVPLVKIMCLSYSISSIFVFHQGTLAGLGMANYVLKMTAILSVVQISVIFFYRSFDLTFIFFALISVSCIRALIVWNQMVKLMNATFIDMLVSMLFPAKCVFVLLVLNYFCDRLLSYSVGVLVEFLFVSLMTAAVLLLMIIYSDNPMRPLLKHVMKITFRWP